MADKNVPSAEKREAKLKAVESKQKKSKKEPMSFKKIITIVIIAVLALLMVGGVSYVMIMVSQSKAEKASAWGSYDGEDIRIENNNVFYNTLMNDTSLQNAYLSGDYNAMLSSYYNAYQAQVLFTALSKEAKKAGIVAPQKLVNDLIISNGIYNGSDGKFSEEVFNASSEADRVKVNKFYTDYYPYSLMVADMQTAIVTSMEENFVVDTAKDTRSFDYFIIDYNAYPNDLAAKYGTENASLFSTVDLSVITVSTEEKANAAHEALDAGSSWEDVVKQYSEDSYASAGGSVGSVMLFSITSNLKDSADLEKVTALEVGAYSSPIQAQSGYTIYKLNSAISEADFTDPEVLAVVKYYIDNKSIDDVKPYIDAALTTSADLAKKDFALAAESVNATVVSINDVSNNVGECSYITGISTIDSSGYLASAASDENISRELFTADEGYVSGAIPVSNAANSYVIAKVTGINKNNDATAYYPSMVYGYYARLQPAYDRFYNILTSDKHVDNFYSQFFSTLFSSNN